MSFPPGLPCALLCAKNTLGHSGHLSLLVTSQAPNWQVIDFPEAIREKGKVLERIMETEPRPLIIWAEAD